MSYERTDQTKQKQSESMKAVMANKTDVDFAQSTSKRRETASTKGSRLGRPPKPEVFVTCGSCSEAFVKKSNKTKYCSSACYRESQIGRKRSADSIAKMKAVERKYPRPGSRRSDLPEYRKYRNRVQSLTYQNYETHKHIVNPNDYPRGLAGVEGAYHIDHVVEVRECFKRGWSPEEAANVNNLRMLPWRDNLMRTWSK